MAARAPTPPHSSTFVSVFLLCVAFSLSGTAQGVPGDVTTMPPAVVAAGACTASSCDACIQQGSSCGWCVSEPGSRDGACSVEPQALQATCPTQDGSHLWANTTLGCEEVHCRRFTNCDECVTSPSGNCGWCSTTGACHVGDAGGALVGMCPARDDDSSPWRWRTCSNTCSSFQTCEGCTDHSSCGWCVLSRRCRDGSTSGSNDRKCTATGWTWDMSACCHQYKECSDCTSQAACGWCNNVCVSGTLLGPNAGVSCSASDWDYTGNCSSSGSGLWVVVAVVAPLLVIGGAVTMYKRYRRRQRQRTSYQPVQPVYGHVDVPIEAGDATTPPDREPLVDRSGSTDYGGAFLNHPAFAPAPTPVENPPAESCQ